MSVPYWRKIEYTDDGCSLYQCLMCYRSWEGRSSPGYCEEHEYHADWHFCPYCSTKWLGPIRNDWGNTNMLGPRRLRIQKAEDYEAFGYPHKHLEGRRYWLISGPNKRVSLTYNAVQVLHYCRTWLREHDDTPYTLSIGPVPGPSSWHWRDESSTVGRCWAQTGRKQNE